MLLYDIIEILIVYYFLVNKAIGITPCICPRQIHPLLPHAFVLPSSGNSATRGRERKSDDRKLLKLSQADEEPLDN